MKTPYKHLDIYNIIFCLSLTTTIAISPLFNPGFQPSQHRLIISCLEFFTIFTFFIKGYKFQPASALPTYIKLILILWCFSSLLSMFFSYSNIPTAASRQTEWFIHLFFGWTIYSLLIQKNNLRFFIQSLPVIASLLVIIGFFIFWFYNPAAPNHDWASPPFFINIRHLSHLAVAALLLIPFIHKKIFFYTVPLTCLLWALIIWSGGRSGILAAAIAITTVTFLTRNWQQFLYQLIAFFVGSYLSTLNPIIYSDIFKIINQQATTLSLDLDRILSGRITIWSYSLEHLLNNPIFGAGIERFKIISHQNGHPGFYHPHNFIIQFLLEWGVIGGSAFLFIILKSHLVMWKHRNIFFKDDLTTSTFSMYIAFFLISLFSGIYYFSYSILLLVTCNALLFSRLHLFKEKQNNP